MEKVLLCLSGQISKKENCSLSDIYNYHRNYIDFDNVICHLWKSEFDKYSNEILCENFKIIYNEDSYPFDENLIPYIDENELNIHTQNVRFTNGKNWHYDPIEVNYRGAYNTSKMIAAFTEIFNEADNMNDYDIFIRSRYDMVFMKNLELNSLKPYLKSNHPVIFVPKNTCNYGLIDIFWIMNRPALKLFKNYLNDCRKYSLNERVYWSEPLLRYHLINIHKAKVYRFNFPCSLHNYTYDFVPDMKTTLITRDLKKFKHGEHIDSWFIT